VSDRDDGEARLKDHEYDGIQEYDNPLPGWWTGIFLATIVYSLIYVVWYHGPGPGKSVHEEYEAAMRAHHAVVAAARATRGEVSEDALAALSADAAAMVRAADVYARHCLACHGPEGQGLVGPNLTDEFQIHGASRADLHRVIVEGVPDKGMIAWEAVLRSEEILEVTAYVASMRGTNVTGGKPAEGARIALP
jgi:cytochrome c oxidase cbb3-type subunit III